MLNKLVLLLALISGNVFAADKCADALARLNGQMKEVGWTLVAEKHDKTKAGQAYMFEDRMTTIVVFVMYTVSKEDEQALVHAGFQQFEAKCTIAGKHATGWLARRITEKITEAK